MADRLTLEQLRKAAEEKTEKKKGKIRVLVCYTSCSIAVGANEVLRAMEETLADSKIDNVLIQPTGCLGICSKEPLVDVYTPDGNKYTYEFVDEEKARKIILSHSELGNPLEEYLLKM
jgi:NADP-reducing hydrogenase subunit HndB